MRLEIKVSPHAHCGLSTQKIMFEVMIALLPAVIAALYFFKWNAALLITNSVLSAAAGEYIILKIRKKPFSLLDGSAILTGLLFALILPPTTRWYAVSLGSAFAIIVGKQLFGGLGFNIFNPALIGRAFLMAAYPKMMTTYISPAVYSQMSAKYIAPQAVDAISTATPLMLNKFSGQATALKDLFFGSTAGSLGETSALCLIAGGAWLLIRKIADWRIPLTIMVTIGAIVLIAAQFTFASADILFHLFSGGIILGVFFMATDPVTTPVTRQGRYIFAIGCAVAIMVLRYYSGLPEGVMYSILLMNAFTPLINRYSRPKAFGG